MIKLFNNDCLNVLKEIPNNRIDFTIIDPPYEQEFHGGGQQSRAKDYTVVKNNTDFMNNGFDYEQVLPELVRVTKGANIVCFCSNSQIAKLMTWFENNKIKATLTAWKKTNACPLGNGKYISDLEFAIFARAKGATWNYEAPVDVKYKLKQYPFVSGKKKLHPAEKPLELIKEYINLHSKEGDTVLDCYMGSGTTGIACKELGRRFIGIEIIKDYFEIAEKRISECNVKYD